MSRTNTLSELQRKFGSADPTWDQVIAMLGFPASYRRALHRSQYAKTLGMYQLHSGIRSPWYVKKEKLADYIDAQRRRSA